MSALSSTSLVAITPQNLLHLREMHTHLARNFPIAPPFGTGFEDFRAQVNFV